MRDGEDFPRRPRSLTKTRFAVPGHLRLDRARINARQIFLNHARHERGVGNLAKMFGHKPDRLLRGHPLLAIKSREVHRARVTPQGAFESEIEVGVKITERQLAQGPMDRLAITASGEIRFGNRAPQTAHFENRDDMIGVVVRFEIEDEGRKSDRAQGGRGEDGSF